MAAVTREQVLTALFAKVVALPIVENTVSRRLVQFPNVPPDIQPAVYQIEHEEETARRGTGLPPKRVLMPQLWFYAISGTPDPTQQTTQGGTAINNFLDQVEAMLAPDDLAREVNTLGGLVYYCRFEGRQVKVPGDWGTQALGIARLRIVMP